MFYLSLPHFSYELYRRKRHIVVCRRDAYRNRCYQKYQRQQQNCKAQILFFSHISVKKVAGGHKVAPAVVELLVRYQ